MAMTFHESYGEVSTAQLAAYKRFNVSQSDHDQLVEHYGTAPGAHQVITIIVSLPKYRVGGSFSIYKWGIDHY